MRIEVCQSLKADGCDPVSAPRGTVNIVPLRSNLAVVAMGVCAAGRNFKSAWTWGRLPAWAWIIALPASVGAPLRVVPTPSCRSHQRWIAKKKNVLSFRIRPPKVPPAWFSIRKGAPLRDGSVAVGLQKPPALFVLLQALSALSLWNQNAEPWKSFEPLLVIALKIALEFRPYSAL